MPNWSYRIIVIVFYRRTFDMIIKYPKKGESIYELNPVLENIPELKNIGEIKMRFVALFTDKVDSPFRHKTGEQLANSVAKCIPEIWNDRRIKENYISMVELREGAIVKAIKAYDELFNPVAIRKIAKRIENLNSLSEAQDEFLNYKNNKTFSDDKKEKYHAECSKMIKDGILRKTTEEILYYERLLSEHNPIPLDVITRADNEKEK